MEIIEIKKKAILLDADEIEKLKLLIMRIDLVDYEEEDLKRFAEYLHMKLKVL